MLGKQFPLRATTGKAAPISEAALQRCLIDYLNWAVPSVVAFAIPNAGRRTMGGRASNAVAGLRKGVFDLGIILPPGRHLQTVSYEGRVAFVEVKTTKGRLSAEQQEFQDILIRERIPHCIARRLEDLRDALKIWGIETLDVSLPKIWGVA